jgi:hypothetical protein
MKHLHRQAFLTNFELACEFGVLALVTDFLWVLHDVSQNGISTAYILIGTSLLVAAFGTAYALYRHHCHYTHRLVHKYMKARYTKGYSF